MNYVPTGVSQPAYKENISLQNEPQVDIVDYLCVLYTITTELQYNNVNLLECYT